MSAVIGTEVAVQSAAVLIRNKPWLATRRNRHAQIENLIQRATRRENPAATGAGDLDQKQPESPRTRAITGRTRDGRSLGNRPPRDTSCTCRGQIETAPIYFSQGSERTFGSGPRLLVQRLPRNFTNYSPGLRFRQAWIIHPPWLLTGTVDVSLLNFFAHDHQAYPLVVAKPHPGQTRHASSAKVASPDFPFANDGGEWYVGYKSR
jgi:hypothetical protein